MYVNSRRRQHAATLNNRKCATEQVVACLFDAPWTGSVIVTYAMTTSRLCFGRGEHPCHRARISQASGRLLPSAFVLQLDVGSLSAANTAAWRALKCDAPFLYTTCYEHHTYRGEARQDIVFGPGPDNNQAMTE